MILFSCVVFILLFIKMKLRPTLISLRKRGCIHWRAKTTLRLNKYFSILFYSFIVMSAVVFWKLSWPAPTACHVVWSEPFTDKIEITLRQHGYLYKTQEHCHACEVHGFNEGRAEECWRSQFLTLDKGAVVTVLQKTYRLNGHRCHQILTQDGQMGWLKRMQGDDEIQPPHDWITKKLIKDDEARKKMSRQEYQTWLHQGKILPDIILKIATPIVAPLVIIGILICIFFKMSIASPILISLIALKVSLRPGLSFLRERQILQTSPANVLKWTNRVSILFYILISTVIVRLIVLSQFSMYICMIVGMIFKFKQYGAH